jgi:hypothetical protein
MKIEVVLGEDQFGFRRGKGTRDAIWMPRIMSEQISEGLSQREMQSNQRSSGL